MKVQKSSNKLTVIAVSRQLRDFRVNFDILWHGDENKGSKTRRGDTDTIPQGSATSCVIFQSGRRPSGVWRIPPVRPASLLTPHSPKLVQHFRVLLLEQSCWDCVGLNSVQIQSVLPELVRLSYFDLFFASSSLVIFCLSPSCSSCQCFLFHLSSL